MIAIIAVVSVMVGAVLQYFVTRYLDGERHHREPPSQAYADYLKTLCEQAQLGNRPYPKGREALAKAAETRCRILPIWTASRG
ncbi:hypothetical protein J2X58_001288 [Luteibacter sp. 3190]|nr:hypothetical protein [Luteibacter sp. 3190]